MEKLNLRVVTPDSAPISDKVDYIQVKTRGGYISILPHHMSLLANVEASLLTIVKDGKQIHCAAGGGAIYVDGTENSATLILQYLIPAKDISLARAESEAKAAEQRLELASSKEEQRSASRDLAKAKNLIEISKAFKE